LLSFIAGRLEVWVAIGRYKSKLNSPGKSYFMYHIKLVYCFRSWASWFS